MLRTPFDACACVIMRVSCKNPMYGSHRFMRSDEPHSLQQTLMTTETQASKRIRHKQNNNFDKSCPILEDHKYCCQFGRGELPDYGYKQIVSCGLGRGVQRILTSALGEFSHRSTVSPSPLSVLGATHTRETRYFLRN